MPLLPPLFDVINITLMRLLPSTLTISLLGALLLCSCQDSGQSRGFDKFEEELSRTLQSAKEHFEKIAPEREKLERKAQAEAEKLFVFEYHVEEFGRETKTDQIRNKLAELGKNRWDCFHIEPRGNYLLLFCKRQPKTYLKYIPRMF